MILMNLKMDNVLSFSNFEINFSYPKKLNKSSIEGEYLKYLPSFRYKKLNIFIGANASGKTSLMKCIWKVLYFLVESEKNSIEEIFNKSYEESYIELDLVCPYIDDEKENEKNYCLKRIKIKNNNVKDELLMSCVTLKLNNGDSYESRIDELKSLKDMYMSYIECLKENNLNTGWHTVLPATENGFDVVKFIVDLDKEKQEDYEFTLNQVLKTLDPAIINVSQSLDAPDAYVIEHEATKKIIIQSGMKISGIDYLSSGTKYGINIANIVYSIKNHNNGIYLIDEQFSYVNSDVEVAMINTMSALLGDDEQLFFTTHNSNVLEIKFPFHSFNFMKKERIENRNLISCTCASVVENRNNLTAKTIIDNDILLTAPNVNRIFELGE